MVVNLKEILSIATNNSSCIPQFNVWNCEMLFGVLDAVEQAKTPVILACGPSFLKPKEMALFTKMLISCAKNLDIPIAIHCDHSHTLPELEEAINLGYTSFMMDGSALSLEDNINISLQAKQIAERVNVSIEGELGYIGSEFGEDNSLVLFSTSEEDAKTYVCQSKVDALAISIGNAHGIYKKAPKLDFLALERIAKVVKAPLVLHGGSGIPDNDIKKAISKGIRKINFHSELCLAAESITERAYKKRFSLEREAICKKALEKIQLCLD